MKYVIPGEPIPLQRHRHNNRKTYDPQSKLKKDLQYIIKAQHGGEPLFEGALYLSIRFYLSLPKRKAKNRIYTNHYCKPDLSNLIKFIEDLCNKIIYDDDCLISHINAVKSYTHQPRTEFTVVQIFTPKELYAIQKKSPHRGTH